MACRASLLRPAAPLAKGLIPTKITFRPEAEVSFHCILTGLPVAAFNSREARGSRWRADRREEGRVPNVPGEESQLELEATESICPSYCLARVCTVVGGSYI